MKCTPLKVKVSNASLNIAEFQKKNKYPEGYDVFKTGNNIDLSPESVLAYITIHKAKGHNVIPFMSECGNPCEHAVNGCTGFDYKKDGCPGRFE
jgi:hypothetical protein